jgi:hypothetical protein
MTANTEQENNQRIIKFYELSVEEKQEEFLKSFQRIEEKRNKQNKDDRQ